MIAVRLESNPTPRVNLHKASGRPFGLVSFFLNEYNSSTDSTRFMLFLNDYNYSLICIIMPQSGYCVSTLAVIACLSYAGGIEGAID